jgi:small subunit ribosomal protein S6
VRRYETIFITDPNLPDEDVTGLVNGLNKAITENRGEPVKTEDWGCKKLAYVVRKHAEGRYVRLEYEASDGDLTQEVERRLRMTEPVLKFMTIRIDNDQKRLVWEAKQAVKEKERVARRAAEEEATAVAAAGTTEDTGSEEPHPAATEPAGDAREVPPPAAIRPDAGEEG